MTISTDFYDALNELACSNPLNGERAVTYFLQAAAEESELISFLNEHAPDVALREELAKLVKTKTFPEDPETCLPFAFTLLYLFDQHKKSLDDVTGQVFPEDEPDAAYDKLIALLCNAIRDRLDVSVAENEEKVTEKEESEDTDVFAEFCEKLKNTANPIDRSVIEQDAIEIKKHVAAGNLQGALSAYISMTKTMEALSVDVKTADGIRLYLLALGGRR